MPTYTHNDYYGYINKIQEKAIQNPEWFWNTTDGGNARRWLYDNNASSIVDTIYQNTPEEIQRTIKNSYLTKNTAEKRMTNTVQEGMNSAGKTAFKIGMATAFAPALISGLAVAPITTIGGLLGAKVGSTIGGNVGKRIGLNDNSTYTKDGASIIEYHPYSGQELGEFVGSTVGAIPGGLIGSAGDAYVAHKTGNDFWWSLTEPAQNRGRAQWYKGRELMPEFKKAYQKYQYGTGADIQLDEYPTISQIPETLETIADAEKSIALNKKWGTYPDGFRVWIKPGKHLGASYHGWRAANIGTKGEFIPKLFGFTRRGVISHEIAHENPLFNTEKASKTKAFSYSPLYDNDYSKIPIKEKKWLMPTGLRKHSREIAESYSDLMGTRDIMEELGYGERPYSFSTFLKYKFSPMGLLNRYFRQHPGWMRQWRTLNDVDFSENVLENMELPEEEPIGGLTLKTGGKINKFISKLHK